MYKLSKGDLAVNQSASVDQYAALTNKDLQKNKDLFFNILTSLKKDSLLYQYVPQNTS